MVKVLLESEMLSSNHGTFDPPSPRIIFACKSNTCRSQMAEAWAKTWLAKNIKEDRLTLGSLLQKDRNQLGLKEISKEDFLSYAMALVASAALGSSYIFESENETKCDTCCEGGVCFIQPDAQISRQQKQQRKTVKSKAIQTMKELGVDMGSCHPKAFSELMMSHSSSKCNKAEKVIIMCDCNIAREEANRYGETFEEWKIDAPTAAEKAGEVHAYKRISLEIKRDVDRLMEQTFLQDSLKKEIM